MHIQPPPKKWCCSHAKTASSTYAARGNIRLSPNGLSDAASAAESIGARSADPAAGEPFET